MRNADATRDAVRRRAGFRCEYCGTTETDAGGELTLDHYTPQSADGSDDLNNLVYCCSRCNLFKSDSQPQNEDYLPLWNPRLQAWDAHFTEIADGTLHPLTPIAGWTIRRLRLNRPQLVTKRLERRQAATDAELLRQTVQTAQTLLQAWQVQTQQLEDQQQLLQEQRRLLWLLRRQRRQH